MKQALLILLLLPACTSGVEQTLDAPPIAQSPLYQMRFHVPEHLAVSNEEDALAAFETFKGMLGEFTALQAESENLTDEQLLEAAHKRLSFYETLRQVVYGEQGFAQIMLRTALGRDEIDQTIVALHVEGLIRHQSPEAALLADGLTALRGYWSDDDIAEAARVAEQSAVNAAGAMVECERCDRAEIVARLRQDPTRVNALKTLLPPLERLDALRDGS